MAKTHTDQEHVQVYVNGQPVSDPSAYVIKAHDNIVVAYAGARAGRTPLGAVAVIGTVALAATLGSSFLYLVARHSGPTVMHKLLRVLHLRPERLDRIEVWFRARGVVAIVIGRLVPGLRTPTTVMSGLAGVPYRTFVPSTAVAAVIWSAFYYFLGGALRHMHRPVISWLHREPDQAVLSFSWLVSSCCVSGSESDETPPEIHRGRDDQEHGIDAGLCATLLSMQKHAGARAFRICFFLELHPSFIFGHHTFVW